MFIYFHFKSNFSRFCRPLYAFFFFPLWKWKNNILKNSQKNWRLVWFGLYSVSPNFYWKKDLINWRRREGRAEFLYYETMERKWSSIERHTHCMCRIIYWEFQLCQWQHEYSKEMFTKLFSNNMSCCWKKKEFHRKKEHSNLFLLQTQLPKQFWVENKECRNSFSVLFCKVSHVHKWNSTKATRKRRLCAQRSFVCWKVYKNGGWKLSWTLKKTTKDTPTKLAQLVPYYLQKPFILIVF